MSISIYDNSLKKVLFVSHKETYCGVYQYGVNVAKSLTKSKKYSFVYVECSKPEEFLHAVNSTQPSAIIYNYHPLTLPWLNEKIVKKVSVPHIQIMHEVSQEVADLADASLFQFHIASDPTLQINNPIVFKTGRLVPAYVNTYKLPEVATIGSFGFGLQGKGFESLVMTVQQEYDQAVIRLHIPFAAFGDSNGENALATAQRCKDLLIKPGIKLLLNHEFLAETQLLDFLAKNTLNAFFYEKYQGRGLSSVIDYALAVQRPIAITRSNMFRHILSAKPSVCIEDSSLKQIIDNGIAPISSFSNEWNEANLIWDYERILDKVLQNPKTPKNGRNYKGKIRKVINKLLGEKEIQRFTNHWIQNSVNEMVDYRLTKSREHLFIDIPNVTSFNRILNNDAREQYRRAIAVLFALVPDVLYRKIQEANIQQAFVFDTVQKFARQLSTPKILCVGSYEDTAALGLKRTGIRMEEIDPVLNYDLDTYFGKPSTVKNSYDIIFSTSVLEHVENDELFIKQIARLLAPGGTAILTCDYNDQYKQGDRIPQGNFRFYTEKDLMQRILPLLKDCSLVDDPQWNCPEPDFTYAGCTYTFATLVFQKNKTWTAPLIENST
jgi:SAM-dependent methyltransferase